MNRTIQPLIATTIVAAIFLSAPTVAQDTQKGMATNMPTFAEFDLNGDGTITETEFAKARGERIAKLAKEGRQMKNLADAPSLGDIDVDGNGGIDADEFAAHQAEHKVTRIKR